MKKEVYTRDDDKSNIDYRDEKNNRICFSGKTDKNKKEKCEKIPELSPCLHFQRWIFLTDKNPNKRYKRGNDANFIFFVIVSFSEIYFAHILERDQTKVSRFDSMICFIGSYEESDDVYQYVRSTSQYSRKYYFYSTFFIYRFSMGDSYHTDTSRRTHRILWKRESQGKMDTLKYFFLPHDKCDCMSRCFSGK